MRLIDAELIDSRRILPGQWMQWYHAPALAASVRAGQFVHVRTGDWSGLVLRRPFTVNTADPSTGVVSIHFREVGRGTAWLTHMRPGDRLDMLGPLGQGFVVDPRNRHLLLVAGGLGIADVRLLADEALRDGRQVVLLFGARDASEVYPSSLLPDELEYVVATEDGSVGHPGLVTDLVLEYEAWADQAFACGPLPMLRALAAVLAGRKKRLGVATLGRKRDAGRPAVLGTVTARRKAFLQVAMEQRMGCAVGACLGCVIWGVDGPQRVCREGPVFAAEEIDWDATVPAAAVTAATAARAPAGASGSAARGPSGARGRAGPGRDSRDSGDSRDSRRDGGRR
jgi:dihydroorotate dehydrogenase electron transfer subunit